MSEGTSRTMFTSTDAFACCRVAVAEGAERSVGVPQLSKVQTFPPALRGTPIFPFPSFCGPTSCLEFIDGKGGCRSLVRTLRLTEDVLASWRL